MSGGEGALAGVPTGAVWASVGRPVAPAGIHVAAALRTKE